MKKLTTTVIIIFNILYITIFPVFDSFSHLLHAADMNYKDVEADLERQLKEQRSKTAGSKVSVLPDSDPPLIMHEPLVEAYQGEGILIEVVIEDKSDLADTYLHFRTKGEFFILPTFYF